MNTLDLPIGQLAREIPGATAVFHALQLDFCCGGKHTLREAAALKQLDAAAIAQSLEALQNKESTQKNWNQEPTDTLIDHIVTRYHDVHRQQLPELIRLAQTVERVHAGHPDCPVGLADYLEKMLAELELHMHKEEKILFPMIKREMMEMAGSPVAIMRYEHDQHGAMLTHARQLSRDYVLPRGACDTWRALYLGMIELEKDLMDHIHLENNLLFERVTNTTES